LRHFHRAGNKGFGFSPEDLVEKFDGWGTETKESYRKTSRERFELFEREVQRIKESLVLSKRIRKGFWFFMIFHLAIIIGSILGLIFISKAILIKSAILYLIIIAPLLISFLSIISLGIALIKD